MHDTPAGGATDETVFDHARAKGRAIVTENIRDHRPLAVALLAAGETHSGLILTTAKCWPRHDPGALITALDALLATNSDEPVNQEDHGRRRYGARKVWLVLGREGVLSRVAPSRG